MTARIFGGLSLLLIVTSGVTSVLAQEAPKRLSNVIVTPTRSETDVDDVVATVTVLDRDELDRRIVVDEVDLFRDEPDLAMARDMRRFGATRPNIRGLENTRVLQLVDGIRLQDYYNGGGPTNTTMSSPLGVASDFLKRVEVVRGTVSSLYGSDALGGVVGYLTLDPADLLVPGEDFGTRTKLVYTGTDEGMGGSLLAAGQLAGTIDWLLGYSEKQAHEADNRGEVYGRSSARTAPNPQDITDRGLLAKLILHPAEHHEIRLTLDRREQEAETLVERISSSLPRVTAMDGDDQTERTRTSVEWQHDPQDGWYERLSARLYYQRSETGNYNYQTRSPTSASCSAVAFGVNTCYVEQDFFFDQTHYGGAFQIAKNIGDHVLTAGLDLYRIETEQKRDARVWNLTTGGQPGVTPPGKTLAGDVFPLRDFAPGDTDTLGIFIQDELQVGSLLLTPALRYDWRKLDPEPDALSQAVLAANGKHVVSQRDGDFSPKLAALWSISDTTSLYGSIAGGFRAPNYEEVNGHFRNTTQSYGISPNPDLDPETSVGVEFGWRYSGSAVRGQLSIYDNHYHDFIESQRLTCPGDPDCISGLAVTYMSRNLNKVRIYGAEMRGSWEFLPGWELSGSAAWARGTNREVDRPLDSIEPLRMSLALVRDAGTWGAESRFRAAQGVKRVNDYSGTTYDPWYRPPGYGVLDMSMWWNPGSKLKVTATLSNLFDRKYWLWSDIRQADARNPTGVDFYSQPGRNISVSLTYAL